jgi:hypothetical protein
MIKSDLTEQTLTEKLMQAPATQMALRVANVKPIRKGSSVADGHAIYAIGGSFVALVSPLSFPNAAAEEAGAMRAAKAILPPHLASFVMDIAVDGRLEDNRSFIVVPRGRPLFENRMFFAVQKRLVAPVVFEWLRGLAHEATNPSENARREFQLSLEALSAVKALPSSITNAAVDGLVRLSKGGFAPRFCPMHGDLWKGNIIHASDKSLKLIDWRGSRMSGYGLFDLIKFAQSFNIKNERLRNEITIHAQALGLDVNGAFATLLASCGHIYRNLEEFPLESFVGMTGSLCALFCATMPELSNYRIS